MQISMLDPSLFTGRYDDGLCGALARAGHQVTLFARPTRPTDAITPDGYAYRPHFFPVAERMRGVLGEGRAFRAVKAAEYLLAARMATVRPLQADVLHSQWLPFAPADRMMLQRLPAHMALVHTVHNVEAYHGDAGLQGRGYDALLRLFDALIVHGDHSAQALIAGGIAPDKVHVVPHPPMRLKPATAQDMAAVPQPRAPRLLLFGTIRPYKGLELLVDACLRLWRSGHALELAIAGKPFQDVEPIIGKVRDAGFADRLITDFGFLPEGRLDAHMAHADIIVFPYHRIDASGAFLSALHHGKAMVASDVGMFTALSGPVALFEAGNAQALAARLLPLVEQPAMRRNFGEKALGLSRQMGDWNDAARRTAAVYEAALARRGDRL